MVEEEFRLPDVGEGVAEGELVRWLVDVGESVEEDQPLAEVETDKAIVEIPSAHDGRIKALHAEEGEVVPVDDVIITFDVAQSSQGDATESESSGAETPASPKGQGTNRHPDESDLQNDPGEPTVPDGRVFAPPHVRRMAREKDIEIESIDPKAPRNRITEADVASAVTERSRSSLDIASEETKATAQTAETTKSIGSEGSTVAPTRDRTLAMPATREFARREGIDINQVPATEERNGESFVTAEDIHAYAEDSPRNSTESTAAESVETGPSNSGESRPGQRIPYQGIRQTIGEQMATSKFTAPHVSHHDEVDVTDLVETRNELKQTAEDREISLTYMPFAIKAVIAGLKQHPELNSELDEASDEIILHDEYNIGIAVATDAGLMVPVIHDADKKGLFELAEELRDLASRARSRNISREEMEGSTFTITNLGAIGGEYASPILNYPEAGILALGEIKEKPAVHDGDVVPRDLLTISMSVDHRIVDGAEAARFTNEVKRYLNNPNLLLLE